eukprot:6189143-Pleurochrysis_carterae.AAC.2
MHTSRGSSSTAALSPARAASQARSEAPTMFALNMPQPCETNWDCPDSMVCCDMLVTNICCDGGLFARQQGMQEQLVPIPVYIEPDSPYPSDRH